MREGCYNKDIQSGQGLQKDHVPKSSPATATEALQRPLADKEKLWNLLV